jgi:hypothetical protein
MQHLAQSQDILNRGHSTLMQKRLRKEERDEASGVLINNGRTHLLQFRGDRRIALLIMTLNLCPLTITYS